MAEMQNKTKKQMLLDRMREKYPDSDFSDEEALYGQIGDDMDGYEKSASDYKERESKLTNLFSTNPNAAQFMTDMAKGNDPWIAVIERLGVDGITDIMNDPDKQEEIAAANKAYVERVAKEKSLEEEYNKNFAESMDLLKRIQQERNLGDDTIDSAMDMIMQMANEAILGKFTEQTIDMALKAVNHDADMENARNEGTIAGRNARIDEKMRKRNAGDGMPVMGGSNNAATQQKQSRSMFDLAGEAR